jgi:hypothetical protein
MFRTRISRVYMVRPISEVRTDSPVKGIRRMNRASEGMVNSIPVKPRMGPYSRGQRIAASDSGKASSSPNSTARTVSWTCWSR